MKAKNLRDLTQDELKNKISELKEELFNLRFQLATGQLKPDAFTRSTQNDCPHPYGITGAGTEKKS